MNLLTFLTCYSPQLTYSTNPHPHKYTHTATTSIFKKKKEEWIEEMSRLSFLEQVVSRGKSTGFVFNRVEFCFIIVFKDLLIYLQEAAGGGADGEKLKQTSC